ncbi:MAG: DegV family protein [Oscillospiraceae bacterium]|nr:DegV family protein [Oscillospiraceae bacterium]
MRPFTIMIDTGADLPQEYIDEHGIATIPIPFNLDGVQHSDGRWQKISAQEFYDALRDGSVAGTALINPESFVSVFTDYAVRGEQLLVITLSGGLSGTYQNSVIALAEVKEKCPDCRICSVDSVNAAGGAGLVAALAVKKRSEGLSLEETAKWLEEKTQSCLALFTVSDLMYLHRGGRLSKVQAIAGSIIGIKPLLNVAPDGSLKLKDKVRGRKAAIKTLFSQLTRSLNNSTSLDTVIISHSNCLEDAQSLATLIKSSVGAREIHLVMMGPVIGTHVGPGCVALFFESDMSRSEYEAKFYGM